MKFAAIVLSALVAAASALRQPDYNQPPKGNPIAHPGLNEQVPAGQAYTISWQPTSPGPVSIRLLRGPSENVKEIGVITASTSNSGSFQWTPSTSLENDVTHYGLLIVDETTGDYQWSTQFGIKNNVPPQSSVPSVSRTVIQPPATRTPVVTLTTTICRSSTGAPYPTGTAPGTISALPTAPTSYRANPTPVPSSPPPYEGAAGRNAISLGGVFLAMAVAFAF
ncbi:hypothetical protein PRK78_004355 [Emydomyces testavorans]|uniref:Yeast cell wall synthesis Kre9/Knh1-like N-terminal domain-containing protein n=1 Tax=Emydomyces testavorans TaxID=2070801 RepID=A0AAF0IJG4_9EURO|nr:hypothetical protein PRK78_004355 [Emydomyces testavorans]